MKYFIDTNIFLRTIAVEDKKSFEECTLFLHKIERNEIEAVCCSLVLAEVAWVLKSYYKFTKAKIVEALSSIVNLKDIAWNDSYDYNLALRNHSSYPVKYIDAMIASIRQVREKEWVVVSYDRDFDKLKVVRKEPSKVSAS